MVRCGGGGMPQTQSKSSRTVTLPNGNKVTITVGANRRGYYKTVAVPSRRRRPAPPSTANRCTVKTGRPSASVFWALVLKSSAGSGGPAATKLTVEVHGQSHRRLLPGAGTSVPVVNRPPRSANGPGSAEEPASAAVSCHALHYPPPVDAPTGHGSLRQEKAAVGRRLGPLG